MENEVLSSIHSDSVSIELSISQVIYPSLDKINIKAFKFQPSMVPSNITLFISEYHNIQS